MRTLVRSTIVNALPINPVIPAAKWYGSGSVPGIPEPMFAELKFGGNYRAMGSVVRRRLEVWIHGPEGDYGDIEKMLAFVKDQLDGAEHLKDGAGNEIISCSWVNDSTDLYDDGYRTNCMMSAYDLVGKESP